MNTLNCPNGYATDEALIFNNPNKCSVSLTVYWGCVGMIFAGRMIYTLFQYQLSRDLQQKRKDISNPPQNIGFSSAFSLKKQKIPLTTTIVFMISLNMILMYILWGFNITNTGSKTGAILYWLFTVLSALEGFMMVRHMVQLGSKVIPIKQFQNEKIVTSMEQIPVFRWAIAVASLGLVCNFILMVVLPIVLPDNTNSLLRASVGVLPLVTLALIVSFYFQTYRLVTHMSNMMKNVKNLGVSTIKMNKARRNFILRSHALAINLTPSMTLYILVCTGVIPFSIFVAIAQCLILIAAELGSSIGLLHRKKSTTSSDDKNEKQSSKVLGLSSSLNRNGLVSSEDKRLP